MQKVQLGKTEETISIMGMGTMYFGTKVDKKTSFELLDRYVEVGGNFLDSANKYASWVPGFNGGESELLLGEWMKARNNRADMFITSKVGFPYEDIPRTLKKEVIISECERSLKRLGVDTIDLFFAHAYDVNTPIEESMEAFNLLKEQGKIRHIGGSNFPSWRLEQASNCAQQNGWDSFTCLQQRHTYLSPNLRAPFGNQLLITPEIEDYSQANGLTLMGYSPLLSGAYSKDDVEIPLQYQSAIADSQLKTLKEIAQEQNCSSNQLVLAWMLHSVPQVLPIVAASRMEQLNENLEAKDIVLSAEQMERLNTMA
ncbi:aldo/keto reductase [Labilibacter marinus]|uniref:aldo/keto reductase n=1 Tax=Labilibacter marinus TaxID=1477105 RepID=UPI00082D2980|nr:aldo/keto reductase [Labilibacter marinus]